MPEDLRRQARRERDGRVGRRMLAIANALDGMSREQAARAAGMDRHAERWNPEDLVVAAVSACYKQWYLSLCAVNGVSIFAYRATAVGKMTEGSRPGDGRFTEIVLRPHATIRAGDDLDVAERLHAEAHENCFVANSVSVSMRHEPVILEER